MSTWTSFICGNTEIKTHKNEEKKFNKNVILLNTNE